MKVLIVDDSMIIRERLQAMLREVEHVEITGHAESYKEAMAAISTTFPDIVILDITMPGKNGIDLLLEIKTMMRPTVVIMLSNYADSYYRSLCEKMGADYFFDKSTEFEKVAEVLNSLVQL